MPQNLHRHRTDGRGWIGLTEWILRGIINFKRAAMYSGKSFHNSRMGRSGTRSAHLEEQRRKREAVVPAQGDAEEQVRAHN